MMTPMLTNPALIATEKQALAAAQRIFPCEDDLLDKIPLERIKEDWPQRLISQEKPFLIRIAGQSGSGKSSQLFPALQAALADTPYVKINVGAFAPFHPHFKKWQETMPDKMRENTNGFALRALLLFCKHCLLNRINIVLDMTLLEPEIEQYLTQLAKQAGYRIQMHLLCVPKKISDTFIRQRQKATGRFVKPSSSDYFFRALAPALAHIIASQLCDRNDGLVLWSHYLTRPIRITHLSNPAATRILNAFQGGRRVLKNPKDLLKSKTVWMKQIIRRLYVSLL